MPLVHSHGGRMSKFIFGIVLAKLLKWLVAILTKLWPKLAG